MTEELMLSILFPIMIYLFTAICIFMTYEIYHSLKKDKEELLNTIAKKVRSAI